MSNFRPLTWQTNVSKQQQDADTLIVGAGVTTSSGNLTITAAGSNVVIGTAAQFAANIGLTVASGTSAFDFSGGSGVFKTSTGAFTIGPGNGASAITTSSGGLTITGAAASTWSTAAGALTLTSATAATWSTAAGALTLSGAAGINLQGSGTSALVVNTAGTAITIQSSATLATTGSGMINLPSLFQINSVAVSANVTSANLGTLTAGSGSNADSLHTHSSVTASTLIATGFTTTGVTTGLFAYGSGAHTVDLTDNAAIATARVVGANNGTSGSLIVAGLVSNAAMTTDGGSPSNGAPVFIAAAADDSAAGAGKLTATAPSSGVVAEVGICVDNSSYAGAKTAKVLLQPKQPIVL